MASIRAVFLDVGGTLLHPDRRFIGQRLVEQRTHLPEDLGDVEVGARALIRSILLQDDPADDAERMRLFWDAFVRHAGCPEPGVTAVVDAIMDRHRQGLLWSDVEDGALDTLIALGEAGYVVAAVSNSDGRVAELLDRAGLLDHIDFVIDSAVVGVEKPDPRIFELACKRAAVTPAEAVHVGDIYEVDVVGARAAGVEAVLMDRGDATDADCLRIRSLPELATLLADGALGAALEG